MHADWAGGSENTLRRFAERLQQIARGPEGQQRLIVDHEEWRAQGANEGDGVVRFGQPAEKIGEVSNLLPGEETGTRGSPVGQPPALQRHLEKVDV